MFYFAFVSYHFTEESENKCIKYKVLKLENIVMQRTGRLKQNSPRSIEDKTVAR